MQGWTATLAGLIAFLCLPEISAAQVSVKDRFSEGRPTVVVAHRSAVMGGAPENTLAWLGYAIERGVDAVHINPQKTADGHYVLMHDNTLNRMTDVEEVYPEGPSGGPTRIQQGGKDFVGYYTLQEIGQLHVMAGGENLPVPTLEEALDFIDGRAIVLLGLKNYDIASLAAVLQGRATHNVLLFELYYSGTDQSKLRDLAAATGLGVDVALFGSRDYLKDLNGIQDQLGSALRGVHVKSAGLSPEFKSRLKDLDLQLFISGWDGGEDYALVDNGNSGPWLEAISAGSGVLTDQPDEVLRLLGR